MEKIKAIELNLPMKEEGYMVGEKGVTAIRDHSIDAEDNYISVYGVYVNGQIYKTIECSPVTVTFFLEGESE